MKSPLPTSWRALWVLRVLILVAIAVVCSAMRRNGGRAMFWKKRQQQHYEHKLAPATLAPPPLPQPRKLSAAADRLAASLREYADEAYRASQPGPDANLDAAKAKVAAARKLVRVRSRERPAIAIPAGNRGSTRYVRLPAAGRDTVYKGRILLRVELRASSNYAALAAGGGRRSEGET